MTAQGQSTPSFQDLLQSGQQALSRLAELGDAMARELAQRHSELNEALGQLAKAQGEQAQTQSELTGARDRLAQTQGQLVSAQHDLAAVRNELGAAQNELAGARSELAKRQAELEGARNQATQLHAQLEQTNTQLAQLRQAHEAEVAELGRERDELKALHGQLTDQAAKLASDWNSRRQALAADNQRLAAEMETATKTVVQGQERERQWKAQVWKLQDDVRTLRESAGRVTLTAEQGHHLYSQLNAIIGFADVLLDESGNRATASERQEFLQHIKDSGTGLADEIGRLIGSVTASAQAEEGAAAAPFQARASTATPVLVAAEDEALRERIQSLLDRAGYRIEFATDVAAAVKIAAQLQPLAVMVDTALSDNRAQRLTDELLREPRTRDIPVVLTVANDEEPLGPSMSQYDVLKKPINRQPLLQVMTKYDLLAERRRVSKMPTSVLVIDDDPKNTRLVQAMLKPFNVDVMVANDGTAGIKLARTRRPDLVILDLMMPEVDGFAVVSEMRADPATAQTPILIYTAKNITPADRQLLQGNIQAIVRKGELSKERFLELVYRRGERRQSPPAAEMAA